jgi:type IV secretion system protein TrbI
MTDSPELLRKDRELLMTEKNERPSDAGSNAQLRGTVTNKSPKPPGLLPKSTQQFVILGLSIVMVLIMWVTGGAKRQKTNASVPTSSVVQSADPATVQDFKETIQKEQIAKRQPISSSDLARLQSLGLAGDVPPGNAIAPPNGSVPQPGRVMGDSGFEKSPDPVREDKRKREYLSLFANNLAFSSRKGEEAPRLSGAQSKALAASAPNEVPPEPPAVSASLEPELHRAETQLADFTRTVSQLRAATKASPLPERSHNALSDSETKDSPEYANSALGKHYLLSEGTVLETLLINRLNGTLAGPVDCLVSTDVYSRNRQRVLIPAGTKVLGEAKQVDALGQQRLAVFFHRLVMPDGSSVALDQFKGLNQIGETALRDQINNHYFQIFGASVAIGVLGGVAEAGTGNALTNSPFDRMREGLGGSLATSSTEILDRFLNILPTITIREGTRVKVYLSGDLFLPDYGMHGEQPDL